ncbi:ribosomal protein L7Ae/L30e/S12e/Gadd45 [Tanacetum coccineum]
MIQHEFITLTLAQFGQILKIPYNGQAVFTNEWDLASLEYSQETNGPYCTELPTPDDIRRLLELERVVVDRTIKSQTVSLNPNQILTKELSPDIKQWEELIRENVFGLGGHRDRLPACLAHMLYCVVAEEQYNLAYFFVKRIQCARDTPTANLPYGMFLTRLYRHVMETYPHHDNGIYNIVERVMRPLALKQTRRPRSDRGKARHSVSSSSSHHQGTSSHQHDDDDDDVKTSRASTPSPTTYLNSLNPILDAFPSLYTRGVRGNPQIDLQDQRVIDSGCSRHMTGNMSYLTNYEEIDRGYVAFGGNPKGGKITGKCTIKTGNLDFENLIDESQVLLRVPRKNNMYSVDLKNIVSKRGLSCLFAKATSDESKLWHRRLGKAAQSLLFTWVFFLATKDETSGILKSFITGIENLVDHKVNVISVARTPQQNGVAERRNRTLIEAARTMLADSKTPTLSFMRPFGCPVTILNTIDHLGKFDGKADESFFVGYYLNSSGPDWLFDIDALTRTMNYEPVVACTQSNGFAGSKASDNADPKSSHDDGSKPSSGDGKKVDEDPRKDSECNDQEKEDNVNSTNNVNAGSTNEVNDVGGKTSIKLLFDPNMPALEDYSIFDSSRDDEDDGAEADMNNLDTTI